MACELCLNNPQMQTVDNCGHDIN